MLNNLKKSKGFTFAELALVLMIIGVIAALTIPSLKKTSQKYELARRAQKAYFTIEECYEQALLLYGPAYKWKTGMAATYISEQLRTTSGATQDNMEYATNCSSTGCDFTVDVNGSQKEPNIEGKDIFKFKLIFSSLDTTNDSNDVDKVIPQGDAKKLQENNWKFTDQLWNK